MLGAGFELSGDGSAPVAVGAVFGNREAGSIDVLSDENGFLIPLERFASLAGARLTRDGDSLRVISPIGAVTLEAGDVIEIAGVTYITQGALEARLATRISFDPREFALRFEVPWAGRALSEREPAGYQAEITPDFRPPGASLTALRLDATWLDRGDDSRTTTSTLFSGRLGEGRWRVRYDDDLRGTNDFREYAWVATRGRRLLLAGHQMVQLHPLLPSFESTGVELGWTDRPLEVFARSPQPTELLPRGVRPTSSFAGAGPPGGLAELRIDGQAVERQTIGLAGTYEFTDVPLPSRELARIEVYVYDRRNLALPIAVHDRSRRTSEYLLPARATIQQGGIGYAGNLLGDALDDAENWDLSAFYQYRRGLNERLTLEMALQRTPESSQAMVGAVFSTGRFFVGSLGVGSSADGAGYDLTFEGLPSPWHVSGRSQVLQAGFLGESTVQSHDHSLTLTWNVAGSLEIGVTGRDYRRTPEDYDFLLPTLYWQPRPGITLRSYPDYRGEQRYELWWWFGHGNRLTLSVADEYFVDLLVRLTRNADLTVGAETRDDDPLSYVGLQWSGTSRLRPSLFARAERYGDSWGYRLTGRCALAAGLLGSVDVRDPAPQAEGERGRAIVVGLNADLAFAGRRVLPGYQIGAAGALGAVGGSLVRRAEAGDSIVRLAGVRVLLDGRPAASTQVNGSFLITNVQAGLHTVELDPEGLPVELSPLKPLLIVEVAAGGVTRVDLDVTAMYSVAGRLADRGGRPLPGATVELVDSGENRVGAAVSDQFGYYRIDGVASGSYTLRIAPGQFADTAEPLPERRVVVTDDFLFDQDLVLQLSTLAPLEPERRR